MCIENRASRDDLRYKAVSVMDVTSHDGHGVDYKSLPGVDRL